MKIYDSDKKLIIVGDLLDSHLIQTQKGIFELEITLYNTYCPLDVDDFKHIDEDCPVHL